VCVYDHCRYSTCLSAVPWNMCSLVECVSDARLCGVRKLTNQNLDFSVDYKLNLFVHEL